MLVALALVPLSSRLPLSVQRCLTILPYEVHPAVRANAKGSSEWRWKMWQVVFPEIPKYFWLGKGYTTSASDHYLAFESARRGLAHDYEGSLVAGDYHNGPLSLIIPFGIWGVLAFAAFLITGGRLLYRNYRDGPPALKLINTFLLASFVGRVLMFFSVFGAIHLDILTLVGFVGMGVSLNGGVRASAQLAPAKEETRPSNLARASAVRV
jgi:O-antigen ligase